MTARVPFPVAIVVTGPAGSGKSKLSRAIAERANCPAVNVGSLMEQELLKHGMVMNHRRDIGPAFLERLGQHAYVDLVVDALRPGVVVEGVRLAVALKEAAARRRPLFHVARTERPGWQVAPSEPFAADVLAMRDAADLVVGWLPTSAALEREATRVIAGARGLVRGSHPDVPARR
ncbi:AAA family ATPase [Actinoplanes sp. NPDC023714]|uniref:AAA family ATPase n=1 Tax=Actinoplanes sp. NPDC023714 TaxID=3154322 RepID=UPI0033EB1B61